MSNLLENKNFKSELEEAREFWSKVAKKNNWYREPFYVQIWVNKDLKVEDSLYLNSDAKRDLVIQEV